MKNQVYETKNRGNCCTYYTITWKVKNNMPIPLRQIFEDYEQEEGFIIVHHQVWGDGDWQVVKKSAGRLAKVTKRPIEGNETNR